jgi:hypothetical protein
MTDHLTDPQAASWEGVKEEFGFNEAEQAEIGAGAKRLLAESRSYRLAEIRRRQRPRDESYVLG